VTLSRRPTLAWLALGAVLGLAGCGIGVDERPRALDVEVTSTTTPDSPTTGPISAVLYFSSADLLFPVRQELPSRTIESVLSGVLQGPPEGQQLGGLGNSVPSGTELLGVQRDNGEVVVNLSSSFDNVVGIVRQQAIGQMVMSVTDQFDVDTMAFEVDGRTLTVGSPTRGDVTEVTACDYRSLLPGPDEAADAGLEGGLAEALSIRRVRLAEQCLDSESSGG
jgi:hypothetical protein